VAQIAAPAAYERNAGLLNSPADLAHDFDNPLVAGGLVSFRF
jgi:hypothetical protein